jgi:hypothetical protein
MNTVAYTDENGVVTTTYYQQSYTDTAVAAAVAAVPAAPVVEPTDTEVEILLSDGTSKRFVPAPTA